MKSETVNFIASMLTEYMKSTIKVRSLTRTLVDSIDCYTQDNEVFLNKKGNVRWFNWGDLRNTGRRKGLLRRFPHISKDAHKLLSSTQTDIDIPKDPKLLICDHVMPIKVIKEHLRRAKYDDPADTVNFLKGHFRRCIITADENILLDKELNQKMPNNWEIGTCSFCRYEAVGIQRVR